MRYFFLLLLITFLCTSGRAQLEITANLGLVADYCSGANPDPNTNCISVPTGNSGLTYIPGQDGDLFFTYRLINNSGKIIRQVQASDSYFGTFFPTQAGNIPDETTVPLNVIYDALTTSEIINGVVTLTVQYADGTSQQVTGEYTLEVVYPMVDILFGVVRQAEHCDNEPNPNECFAPYGEQNGQTINVTPLDTFNTRFYWRNSGLSTIAQSILVDQDNYEIANATFNLIPGSALSHSKHWVAPALSGTYNYRQTLTVLDAEGNLTRISANYIVIVEPPMLEVEFGVVRQADHCDNTPAIFCFVPFGDLNGQTITVGALDTFTTRLYFSNTGLGSISNVEVFTQTGAQIVGTGHREPGFTDRYYRHSVAPEVVGTYNYSLTLVAHDYAGNAITEIITYIVVVEPPILEVEFGVVRQADHCDNTPAIFCFVPFGDLNGQTVTLPPLDTFTYRLYFTNTGLGNISDVDVFNQNGAQIIGTGLREPGFTDKYYSHKVAPEEEGTYNYSITLVAHDLGGNTISETISYQIIVACGNTDMVAPVALCQNQVYTIQEAETLNIDAGQIDDGSYDICGDIGGGFIDITSFTCADIGENTVTLTVGDLSGNQSSCTSNVTINVEEAIYEGIDNDCIGASVGVSPGRPWQNLTSADGKLIAQIDIGANTNITRAKANIYKSVEMTDEVNDQSYLSKRINLLMADDRGNIVHPNIEPVGVRLFYTDEEMAALMAAAPGSNPATFTLFKTSDVDCGDGYSGMNATEMNTSMVSTGCVGDDAYLEFSTSSFSTFYLFATDVVLPVELAGFDAREIDKQRVQLDWRTAIEFDNSHFEVEHSIDGRVFQILGAVAGAGASTEEQAYGYLHETPVVGLNYYRLRQVDYDGTATLSEVRMVDISGITALSLYPNPTVDELQIKGFAGGPVRVIDQQGRTVLQQDLPELRSLDVRALAAGVYVVQAGSEVLRFVKR